jgi:hypothetical protein
MLKRLRFLSGWVVLEAVLCGGCVGLWAAIAANSFGVQIG